MKKSGDMTLNWKGDLLATPLLSPDRLYPNDAMPLLCYVEPVLDVTALGIICK